MHQYCAHIQKEDARYTKITILGLGLIIAGDALTEINTPEPDIQEFVERHTQDYITRLIVQGKEIPNPQKAQKPETVEVNKGDSLMLIRVKIKQNKGCFSRLFPGFGACTSIVSAVSGTMISIASLDLAMGNLGVSVLQAINSNMVIGLTLYFCSPSGKNLESIGHSLDNYLKRQKSTEQVTQQEQPTGSLIANDRLTQIKMCLAQHVPSKMTVINGVLTVAVVANSVSFIVGTMQQLSAVQKESDDKRIMPDWFFNMNKWAFVLSTGISGFFFVSSFFMQLSARIEQLLAERDERKLLTYDSTHAAGEPIKLTRVHEPVDEELANRSLGGMALN